MRRHVSAAALVALALACPLAPGAATAAAPVAGSTSGGDPYFPAAGNGGYDVAHYGLTLAYDPATGRLDGTTVVTLTATADLSSLSLDLRGLTATSVLVDGASASFRQLQPGPLGRGGELVVTASLVKGSRHDVTVVYGGTPGRPTDIEGFPYGFVSFADGAFVANEPEGASTWYPVNDVPTDKATYDFRITVPAGSTAVANGEPVGAPVPAPGGRTTYVWRATDPMASYLSMAAVGNYEQQVRTGPRGLPILDFVDRDLSRPDRATTQASLDLQPAMIAFFEGWFGPYPFTSFGSVVDDDSVGYALENQTRPIYSGVATEGTVAHELSHQWVGDSVTPRTWRDIWLNEGFATYAEWLWLESRGGKSTAQRFDAVYRIPASDAFWDTAPGDPGAQDLFAAATYDRGAAALQALRVKIGDRSFRTLLRAWTTRNADGNVSTADFVRLAERTSGQELSAFFTAWIDTPGKPARE